MAGDVARYRTYVGFNKLSTSMEPIINDDESTVRKLCAEANAERNRARLKVVRCRLKAFLREHKSLLTSMSEETYEALRQRRWGVRYGRVAHGH